MSQTDVTLVKMIRVLDEGEKGPSTADVHPDEVTEYQRHGWGIDNSDSGNGGGNDDSPAGIAKGSIDKIKAAMPGMTAEGLDELLAAEKAGKDRDGAIEAIEAEIEARDND